MFWSVSVIMGIRSEVLYEICIEDLKYIPLLKSFIKQVIIEDGLSDDIIFRSLGVIETPINCRLIFYDDFIKYSAIVDSMREFNNGIDRLNTECGEDVCW